MVQEGRWLPFPRSEVSPHLQESLLVADKWNPNHHGKDAVSANPVVSSFLARAFAPELFDLIQSFSSQPLLSCQWPPNPVTWVTKCLEPTSRWKATHPYHQGAEKAQKRWEHQAESHSPSRLPERLPSPGPPGTTYCLGIHVTLTDEIGAETPPPHTRMAPLVEDMLCHGRTSLTEAVVTVPFYSRRSLGEGLSLGKARDASFTLTRAGTWIGKLAYLTADPLTIREGWQAIAQAITECQIEARGPGHPWAHLMSPQQFRFYHQGESSQKEHPKGAGLHSQPSPNRSSRSKNCGQWQWDWRPVLPQPPSPLPDWGFESDRSLVSTASSVSSHSDWSKGSWHSQCGRWHRETGAHIKQGYSGEHLRSSRTDITLYEVLTVLDKHYNNVKVLDALNQEFFQLQIADMETILDWGLHLLRHLQVLAALFPECFPPDHVAKLKHDCFHDRLPKHLKAMVAYLKASLQDLFWLPMGHKGNREGALHGTIPKPLKPSIQ